MATNFRVTFKRNDGNLHVKARGNFDGNSAWELFNLLEDNYDGQEQIFIETGKIRTICPFGCSTFQCQISMSRIPKGRLFFRGEKGHVIAPEGSNVVESTNHKKGPCGRNCANCRCKPKSKFNLPVGIGIRNGDY